MSQPVVSLPEVIKDNPAPIPTAGRQHNRGGAVGLRGDPRTVEGVGDEECRHDKHNSSSYL